MKKAVIWIVAAIFVVIFSIAALWGMFDAEKVSHVTDKYTIVQQWELPSELKEVSDISWVGDNLMAAVQDEEGIVFLYNLKSSEIVRKIKFGKPGDYEGLAVSGKTIYVMRSDGKLFEIIDFTTKNTTVNTYPSSFTANHDLEGLTIDPKNNRLLLAVKEEKHSDKTYRGIYAFDLQSKKLQTEPVYKISFDDPIFKNVQAKKKSKIIRPSEIDLQTSPEQLFVLDAKIPALVIFSATGKSQAIYFLNEDEFAQPEGLTFDTDGNLYISNEAGDHAANILQIELK